MNHSEVKSPTVVLNSSHFPVISSGSGSNGSSRGIAVKDIQAEAEKLLKEMNDPKENIGIFRVRTANQCIEDAKNRPIPGMLFGELWYEGEICILFADSNLGKSILAVQIAISISEGIPIESFNLESPAQKVLLCDFELSDKQFEARYSVDFDNHYRFNPNFFRAEINPDEPIPDGYGSFEDYLIHSLEQAITRTGAKVLIVDNLTYLKNETEKAKDALPLMKKLKELANRHGLSILVLAHTPKRDMTKPITRNDLHGSKMLMNFCDSSFAIGESHRDSGLRYIKQIKARNIEILYDSENVCLCQIIKPYNILQFEFLSFGSEYEHLKRYSEDEKDKRIADVLELKKQGLSNFEIAGRYGVSEGALRKWIKKSKENENTN